MFVRAFTAALLLSVSISGTVGAAANPEANKPSYWGTNCTKTEMSGETMTFTAPAGATKVVVKGGTDNKVYTEGSFTDLTAPVNPKNGKTYAISHVIVCTDAVVKPAVATTTQPVKPAGARGGGEIVTPAVVATPVVAQTQAPLTLPEAGAGVAGMLVSMVTALAGGIVTARRFVTR